MKFFFRLFSFINLISFMHNDGENERGKIGTYRLFCEFFFTVGDYSFMPTHCQPSRPLNLNATVPDSVHTHLIHYFPAA